MTDSVKAEFSSTAHLLSDRKEGGMKEGRMEGKDKGRKKGRNEDGWRRKDGKKGGNKEE